MKGILCRGKRVDNGRWVFGDLEIGIPDCKRYIVSNAVSVDTQIEIVSETLGHYVGFADSNGTKIFEGDIVCVGGTAYALIVFNTDWARDELVWEDGARPLLDFATEQCVQVVGNIHDNPEFRTGKRARKR